MTYFVWFCLVFFSILVVFIFFIMFSGPKQQDLENVLNAVEKTFPESSTYNVSVFCEQHYKYKFGTTYLCLMILEQEEVVRRFTKDNVYHSGEWVLEFFKRRTNSLIKHLDANDQQLNVVEYDNKISVIFWQITGRLNKDKKTKKSTKLSFKGKFATT